MTAKGKPITKTIFLIFLLPLLSCNNKSPTDDASIPIMRFGNIIDVQPDWSPDGETIAYNHHVDKIYILELASMEKRFVTPGVHPDWPPDGTKIAYELQGNIYVIDVETKEITQLTDWGECFFPSWSPDGKKIAFDTNHGDAKGANAVWIMDAEGSNKKDISQHGTGGMAPACVVTGWFSNIAFEVSDGCTIYRAFLNGYVGHKFKAFDLQLI